MPRSRAWRGEVMRTGLPSSTISPDVAGVMPNSVSANSVRPAADQAGDAENLAAPQREGNVANVAAVIEVRHLQHGVADRGFGLGEQAVDRPADHHRDELLLVDLADVLGRRHAHRLATR